MEMGSEEEVDSLRERVGLTLHGLGSAARLRINRFACSQLRNVFWGLSLLLLTARPFVGAVLFEAGQLTFCAAVHLKTFAVALASSWKRFNT